MPTSKSCMRVYMYRPCSSKPFGHNVMIFIRFVFFMNLHRLRNFFDQDLFLIIVAAPLYGQCRGWTASGAETVQQPYQKNQVIIFICKTI